MSVTGVPCHALITNFLTSVGLAALEVSLTAFDAIVSCFVPVVTVGVSFGDNTLAIDQSVAIIAVGTISIAMVPLFALRTDFLANTIFFVISIRALFACIIVIVPFETVVVLLKVSSWHAHTLRESSEAEETTSEETDFLALHLYFL